MEKLDNRFMVIFFLSLLSTMARSNNSVILQTPFLQRVMRRIIKLKSDTLYETFLEKFSIGVIFSAQSLSIFIIKNIFLPSFHLFSFLLFERKSSCKKNNGIFSSTIQNLNPTNSTKAHIHLGKKQNPAIFYN
jgi:hypothetical protein